MSKLVATTVCELEGSIVMPEFENEAAEAAFVAWSPGTYTQVQTSSAKVKAGGNPILTTTLGWTASGCTFSGGTFVYGGGSMDASSTKILCGGVKPMREGDSGTCTGSFTVGSSAVACSCTVKISSAGQQKVKCK